MSPAIGIIWKCPFKWIYSGVIKYVMNEKMYNCGPFLQEMKRCEVGLFYFTTTPPDFCSFVKACSASSNILPLTQICRERFPRELELDIWEIQHIIINRIVSAIDNHDVILTCCMMSHPSWEHYMCTSRQWPPLSLLWYFVQLMLYVNEAVTY